MKKERRHYSLLLLMAIAFLVRGGVLFHNLDSFNADPDQYKALARNLRTEGVFGYGTTPTAFRPPAYPAMLAAMSFLARPDRSTVTDVDAEPSFRFSPALSPNAAIALLHWALGLATVFLVFELCRLLSFPDRFAALAALLVAVDPVLLQQSRLAMTETAATFFAVASIYALIRTRHKKPSNGQRLTFYAVGLFVGVAALCRPTFLLFALLCFPFLVIFEFQRKIAWGAPMIFLLGAATLLVPWGLRNRSELGRFTLTTTHGGYTKLLANNDYLYDWLPGQRPWGDAWNADEFHRFWNEKVETGLKAEGIEPGTTAAELFQDDLAKAEARRVIRSRPKDFALATLWRINHLWQLIPYRTNPAEPPILTHARFAVGCYYLVELVLAAVGLAVLLILACGRKNTLFPVYRSDWVGLLMLLLSIQLPHLLYWTNMRMRAPLTPAVAILAVLVLTRIFIIVRYKKMTTPEKAVLSGRF